MNKVFCNKETNRVEQIINIDIDTRFDEDWFPWCYVVDDPNNSLKHHGYYYNKETKLFEEIKGYEEPQVVVIPSESSIANEKLNEKDIEILDLKLSIAEVSEEKDNEILNLKLAIAEIIEGGI